MFALWYYVMYICASNKEPTEYFGVARKMFNIYEPGVMGRGGIWAREGLREVRRFCIRFEYSLNL